MITGEKLHRSLKLVSVSQAEMIRWGNCHHNKKRSKRARGGYSNPPWSSPRTQHIDTVRGSDQEAGKKEKQRARVQWIFTDRGRRNGEERWRDEERRVKRTLKQERYEPGDAEDNPDESEGVSRDETEVRNAQE